MYDIICEIIGITPAVGSAEQQFILYGCLALIQILMVVFTDLIYRIFSHFWRG